MKGAPRQRRAPIHVASRHQGPDPGGGHRLAVDLDKRHHPGLELGAGGEHLWIALRPGAEAEVLPDRDPLGPEPLDQDPLDEALGRHGCELAIKGDDDQLAHPQSLDHVALHREWHDQLRQRRRVEDFQGVGIEGEDRVGGVDHLPVAQVDAVEGADRDVAGAQLRVGQSGDLDAHRSTGLGDQLGDAVQSQLLTGVLDLEGADRGATQRGAEGVLQRLEQGSNVGPG